MNFSYIVPANLTPEFSKKYREYRDAKAITQKIRLLRELIGLAPKHKGTENLLAQLKRTLARLEDKKEAERRAKKHKGAQGIKKVAPLIVLVGPPNSGKTTLFNKFTGQGEPKPFPFSTQRPQTAIGQIYDARIQFIDCPSFDFAYANNADVLLFTKPLESVEKKFPEKEKVYVENKSIRDLKKEIWRKLKLMRIYTENGTEPLLLKKGATMRAAAKEIHKTMLEGFEWARVTRGKKKFKVGLDFRLQEGDVIWIKSKLSSSK